MKHSLRSWVFGLTLFLAGSAGVQAKQVLKFGTVAPDNTPWADELKGIQKRVDSESGGNIQIKTYLGGQLGGELEILQGLRRGRIQGAGLTSAALASAVPEMELLEIPFLFESNEEADFILDNYLFEPFKKLFEKRGLVLVTWAENGWRDVATKSKVVRTPADLKGLKIRSQESKVHLGYWKKLGANPVPIPVPEVLSSLQTGLVEGFDNTPLFTLAAELHTAIKHYSVSRHIYQPAAIVYSKQLWDGLNEGDRKILMGSGNAQAAMARKAVRALGTDLLGVLREAGIQVVELSQKERMVFRDAVKGLDQELVPQIGGDSQAIFKLIQEGKKAFAAKKK
jgi:tripartite ATP-independent transporter DctP family solute receptor